MSIMPVEGNTFNEIKEGAFFYLPNNARCIKIVPVMVKHGNDASEKVNYYNFFSNKFGYLSGLEPVTLCPDRHNSMYVNSCRIEH